MPVVRSEQGGYLCFCSRNRGTAAVCEAAGRANENGHLPAARKIIPRHAQETESDSPPPVRRFGTNFAMYKRQAKIVAPLSRIHLLLQPLLRTFFYLFSQYTHNSCLVSMSYQKIYIPKSFCNARLIHASTTFYIGNPFAIAYR